MQGTQRHIVNFTPRQLDVLVRLATGKKHQRIATELGVQKATISSHTGVLRHLVHAPNNVALALIAVAGGLLTATWPPSLTGRRTVDLDRLPRAVAQ